MIELNGKFNSALVYTNVIDQESISQIISMCNQKFCEGSKIRIMPDVHAGAGCTIGTTMTLTDKVVPNLVGVDIGCGMEVQKLKEKKVDFVKIDEIIRALVPSGFEIRKTIHKNASNVNLSDLYCFNMINSERAMLSIGTLGGGNHFIEIDRGEDDSLYLVIHSGSRHLGVEIAKWYQEEAHKRLTKKFGKDACAALVEKLKSEGRQSEISNALKNLKKECIPKEFAYCEGELFEQYIHDMRIAQSYATVNRMTIAKGIVDAAGLHIEDRFSTIHNYIDTETNILRKGAVSAQRGETLLIPINMRDGSLLCVGKGNSDWNFSAPHGAGRLMSRSQAKQQFTVAEYEEQMNDIFTTSVNSSTLDECPMAYKSINDIVNNIGDTVEIIERIKPVYNFKAGEESEVLGK